MGSVRHLRKGATAPATWSLAVDRFLAERDLAPGSRRVYGLTLHTVGQHLGDATVGFVTEHDLAVAVDAAYPRALPATWNRHLATLHSFSTWCTRQGWVTRDPTGLLEARRVPVDHDRAMSRQRVEQILTHRDLAVRDRCLFRMLFETAARSNEVLRLNVEDLDPARKRASTVRKGGDLDVIHWQTGTARLLPHVVAGRNNGPLFLAERAPTPIRAPAAVDLDETTGRARLSYRRAAEVFKAASGGATLHQLRHSALTHLAEDGVPITLLMAKSRHESLRTLQRYARPSVEAVARLTAENDPQRRR